MKQIYSTIIFSIAVCSISFAQPIINGDVADLSYYTSVSGPAQDGFGSDNDLGRLRIFTTTTDIYIGIAGETNSNNNIVIFFDFVSYDGVNAGSQLDPSGGIEGNIGVFNNGGLDEARMDMEVDFALAFNEGSGTSNYFLDAARYGTGDMFDDEFIGQTSNQTGTSASLDLTPAFGGTGNMDLAYNNNFSGNVNKGVEMRIPVSAFPGVTSTTQMRLFVVISNNTGFCSNECLPGDKGPGNAGDDFNWNAVASQNFFTGATTLPITLTAFIVEANNDAVNLTWSTSTEINNSHFEIETSTDANNWSSIGKINAIGNSVIHQEYRFTHNNPKVGSNYYRLKQIDFDNEFSYSQVREANIGSEQAITIFPNPMVNQTLYFSDAIAEVEVFTSTGISVFANSGNAIKEINFDKLANGLYLIHYVSAGKYFTQSFMKQ